MHASTVGLPYKVLRTRNGELPVYRFYRSAGKQINTVVRHISGDFDRLRKELSSICEAPVRVHIGSLEVKGLHTWKIKEYLESNGL